MNKTSFLTRTCLFKRRHRSDAQVNNRKSILLRDGQLVEEKWHKVIVGDIIKMENNQFVAVRSKTGIYNLMDPSNIEREPTKLKSSGFCIIDYIS